MKVIFIKHRKKFFYPQKRGQLSRYFEDSQHKTQKLIGVIQENHQSFEIISVSKKDKWAFPISPDSCLEFRVGDLVNFSLSKHVIKGRKVLFADQVQIVKPKIDHANSLSIIALEAHHVPYQFSDEINHETSKIKEITPENTSIKRVDLTDLPFITIDPKDARDHDDAIYTQYHQDGAVIYVAIADVSAYVEIDGLVDQEAQLRGNSIYLPDCVIPMLPEYLSNNLCSLKAHKIKPALVVKMHINASGQKTEHQFMRAFIKCDANLSYEDVYAASLDIQHKDFLPYQEKIIQPLIKTYNLLKIAHNKRAPLDLDLPEYCIALNELKQPIGVHKKERLFTHRLIEEFMVLANVCAAETLEDAEFPVIYRSHEPPAADKVVSLYQTLKDIDIPFKKYQTMKPSYFNQLLQKAYGTEIENMMSKMVLRVQSQAIYNINNEGHFGLNLKRYVHFTSPIRRYADLMVHRSLIKHLDLPDKPSVVLDTSNITNLCQHISSTERKAMKIELETKDRFLAELLQDKCSENFQAHISGLTNAGIFVRLPDYGAEGFVPIQYLSHFTRKRRYFQVNETRHILQDKFSGQYYMIGQKINVSLLEVNKLTGNLIFTIIDEENLKDGRLKKIKKQKIARKSKKFSRKKTINL